MTKGRAEAETPANLNMNYFLGIDATSGVLVADFEDTAGGANHPVAGQTAVSSNVWHHAAASFDGSSWRLYLDGVLEAKLAVAATPEASSLQHAALGSALNSTGVAAGFFQGALDEARVWNLARTGAQLRAARDSELASGSRPGRPLRDERRRGDDGRQLGRLEQRDDRRLPGLDRRLRLPPRHERSGRPQGLAASADDGAVGLTWSANGEPDLAGYDLYRSTSTPVARAGRR